MEFISSLIPLLIVVSIVVSIVSKAKQAQNKQAAKNTAAKGSATRSPSLQEIIRQQIEEQRKAASSSFAQPAAQQPPKPQQVDFAGGKFDKLTSMEQQRYKEGDAIYRSTLEGISSEMKRHSHDAHEGGSYNEGDPLNRQTLEGFPLSDYEDSFDLDVAIQASRKGKSTSKNQTATKSRAVSLKINSSSIVNGIIMSEILNKRGGKRALR
jgi:hypothetical protein